MYTLNSLLKTLTYRSPKEKKNCVCDFNEGISDILNLRFHLNKYELKVNLP